VELFAVHLHDEFDRIIERLRPMAASRRRFPSRASELIKTMAVACRAEASPSGVVHALRLSGTLPPLSASFVITCWCSHKFIFAEPSRAPV
jgi:hypothetical protein